MPTKHQQTFRQLLRERRDYEKNSGERLTDVGGNQHRPMDTKQLVKQLVTTELSNLGQEAGFESFEEADDFEDEDPEPPWLSQFEISDMDDDPEMPPEPGVEDPEPLVEDEGVTVGLQEEEPTS